MKIAFIRPNIMDTRSATAMEPLAFAVLAGQTPPDVELELWDERVEEVPSEIEADLVAITVETFTARRAYQIASAVRRRGIPVVMGGYHVTFLPDEALQYTDAVVLGDAEGLWEEVVEDARRGGLKRRYQAQAQPSLAGVRFDRSIFRGKRYTPMAPVQYGRGCRFACEFCSIHAFYGFTLRQRPVREVVEEIEALGRRYILLVDDNLFVNVSQAEELFRALLPLNIQWACQVTVDVARNNQLMALMARSGCFAALVGFESLDEENLRQMKKRWSLKDGDY
ncbi:MAG: radical SAM protein, partial [Chloroflexota bacterium]|nr:radical SAM protein [Chloroflexota bacterium]